MTDNKNFEINDQALENAAGGSNSYKQMGTGIILTVQVDSKLALRTEPVIADGNIVGYLYTGDEVEFVEPCYENPTFMFVYSPKFGSFGYVACNYVVDPATGRTGVRNPAVRG